MVRMQIVLFAASLLLSSAGRVQRREHVEVVEEEAASEVEERVASGVSANRTKFQFTDQCHADQKSVAHLITYWLTELHDGNKAFPLWGWKNPPVYKKGDCEFKAEAGIFLTLVGSQDIKFSYSCVHGHGSTKGAQCDDCGWRCPRCRECSWPMKTKFEFTKPLGLRLSAKANLNLCGISTGDLNFGPLFEIGVEASINITDVHLTTRDKYDCTGYFYKGFEGTPTVRGGRVEWGGLRCVIDGLVTKGLKGIDDFQDHCSNFLNKLLEGANGVFKDLIANRAAEE